VQDTSIKAWIVRLTKELFQNRYDQAGIPENQFKFPLVCSWQKDLQQSSESWTAEHVNGKFAWPGNWTKAISHAKSLLFLKRKWKMRAVCPCRTTKYSSNSERVHTAETLPGHGMPEVAR